MTTPEFRTLYAKLKKIVRKHFPHAKEGVLYGMRGFTVKIENPRAKEMRGTLDPNRIYIGLAERKAGVTLHLWDPRDYYALDKARALLTKAGFKVMRGCLQWNRKAEYPIEVIDKLLAAMAKK